MKQIIFPALAALGLSVGAAQASTFTVNYQDPSDPFGNDGHFSWVTIDSEIYDGTFRAGGFAMNSDPMGDFIAFCVEVTQALRNGHAYEVVENPFTDAVVSNVQSLFNSAYDLVVDDLTAAGFQVALWEIVEDTSTSLNLGSGTFSAQDAGTSGGSVVGTAQAFLDDLSTGQPDLYNIDFLLSPTSQDLVTAQLSANVAAVPVPASGLLLLSAGGLVLMRRKKQ